MGFLKECFYRNYDSDRTKKLMSKKYKVNTCKVSIRIAKVLKKNQTLK